tara:strand:- start:31702 stop:32583 length:882 start_codon:yes stop_codon:yes gene_type:complete
MNNLKKIIVFGGSGFLGSHAADALSKFGHQVTIFDQINSPWINKDQKMITGDLMDRELISKILSEADIVYHFAGLSDLNSNLDQAVNTAKINILGTVQLLEECKKANIERFIYASSMYVNSNEGGFYKCSKQSCEEYIQEFQKLFNLNYTILRFGSLYGPRSNSSNGLYRIIKKAIDTKIVEYDGSENSLRGYIHVYDMAEACVDCLNDSFKNEIIVLTGNETLLVKDVMFIIAEILNLDESSVRFSHNYYKGHYKRTPYSYKRNIGKKYNPKFSIDLGQGIVELIDNIKNNS